MFGSTMIHVTCVLVFLLLMPTAVTSDLSEKNDGILQQTISETAENDDQNFPKQEDDDKSLRYSPDDTDPPNEHCAADSDAPCTAEENTRSDGHQDKQKANSEKPSQSTLTEGGAALHEACRQGLQDRVKAVLATHPAVINERNEYGQTALHLATRHGHLDIVDVLLTSGADVDPPDSLGWTPLHVACRQGDVRVVKRLHASGANMNATTGEKQTPLLIAAKYGVFDVFKYVAEQEIDINAQDSEGNTALHILVWNEWSEVVSDAPLQHTTAGKVHEKSGRTALFLAAEKGKTNIVELFLQKNANIEHAVETEAGSITPLFIAAQNGHTDVVILLISHGANKAFVRQDGKTPLFVAARNGHTDVVRIFIQHETNVNWPDQNRVTALIVASAYGHVEVVKLLLENGADVHMKDKWGHTAMYYAKWEGHTEVYHLLEQIANEKYSLEPLEIT